MFSDPGPGPWCKSPSKNPWQGFLHSLICSWAVGKKKPVMALCNLVLCLSPRETGQRGRANAITDEWCCYINLWLLLFQHHGSDIKEQCSAGRLLPVHQCWLAAVLNAFTMVTQMKGRQDVHDKHMSHWHLKENVQVKVGLKFKAKTSNNWLRHKLKGCYEPHPGMW